MTEDDADAQERAEAEALARALDGEDTEGEPTRALETAALLRAVAPSELSEDRARAIFADLQPEVEEHLLPSQPRRRSQLWLTAGLALAAAALLYVTSREQAAKVPIAAELPVPPARLLAAQAALGDEPVPEERAAFEREMRAYRARVLKTLKAAYPTEIGALETGSARR